MNPHKIWIEQCQAARGIEDEFGVPKALDYLIGEKFLNFLEAADDDAAIRAELPAFVVDPVPDYRRNVRLRFRPGFP